MHYTLILAPPNATVPKSGPNGLIGDRVHQAPSFFSIYAKHRPILIWPDDVATRSLFSFPGVEFLSGNTAAEMLPALKEKMFSEVFCFYSPTASIPPEREADCHLLREADAIVSSLPGFKVSQPSRLNPLGSEPIWKQLFGTFSGQHELPRLPWFLPKEESIIWAAGMSAEEFPGAQEPNPLVILSHFSGSPKKAVEDAWWRELVSLLSDFPVVTAVYGQSELEKAQLLFAGTNVSVIEADLDQTIALGSLSNSIVIGIDGGRLNLLAASRKDPVYAFYGIWPASAWALPNVTVLEPGSNPSEVIRKIPQLNQILNSSYP